MEERDSEPQSFFMDSFYHPRWPVLHLDNHLLALYKPAGLLSQGDGGGETSLLDLAKGWVRERFGKPGRAFLGLVHRLDRPVAGVMIFARTSKAAARVSEQIRNRSLKKAYLAVVEGRPPRDGGRLVDALPRGGRAVEAARGPSREARLSYRLISSRGGRSLVAVALETGRKHQIRMQLSRLGCPVVGDVRYGARPSPPPGAIALFAQELELLHPTRGEPLRFRLPPPVGWPWPGLVTPQSPPWTLGEIASAMPWGLGLPTG